MSRVITTLGPIGENLEGVFLPHEHVFTDVRPLDTPEHGQAPTEEVVRVMAPCLEEARRTGVAIIAEATPLGVGRRADILRVVSEKSRFPLLVPTGVYREPWIPLWIHRASEEDLSRWMVGELSERIEESNVRAGWIKLSAGDDGLTSCETKVLRAAARAARETGAVIGSHTIRGRVVMDQLGILESLDLDPSRFIWIHAHVEEDFELNVRAARRGAWIEYDGIGDPATDGSFVAKIRLMLDSGLGGRLLLSQDRGWYTPGSPEGGQQKPYGYLCETFLPMLRNAGVDEETIRSLTRTNPFRAFAIRPVAPSSEGLRRDGGATR